MGKRKDRAAAASDSQKDRAAASRPAARSERVAAAPSTRLFVQNLPPNCGEPELRRHFAAYGVTDVALPKKDGARRGFAFVGVRRAEDAAAAVRTYC